VDAAQRAAASRHIVSRITSGLLVRESFRYARSAQVEAESHIIGPRSLGRSSFHAQTVGYSRPVLLGVRPGAPRVVSGALARTVVVSLLSYGYYETDPIPVTRQIDYTYNAQNGALIGETAVIADATTARRFGFPALVTARVKK
jgi:hypothetical protein